MFPFIQSDYIKSVFVNRAIQCATPI